MKKLTCIILMFLFVFLSFLGCSTNRSNIITKDQYISQNKLITNVITTEIDISKIKNLDFLGDINNTTKTNGLYGYNYTYDKSTNKGQKTLILFNGIDGSYSDVKFSLKNNVLTINYKYNPLKGFRGKSLFMIEDTNKDKSYDTLEIRINGKKDTFLNISGLSEIK